MQKSSEDNEKKLKIASSFNIRHQDQYGEELMTLPALLFSILPTNDGVIVNC